MPEQNREVLEKNRHMSRYLEKQIMNALYGHGLPHSRSAVVLLLMIAAHESGGFMFNRQMGGGPALGLFQMEPIAQREACMYIKRAEHLQRLMGLTQAAPERMVTDLAFATCMARIYLMRIPEPLPEADDLEGLAKYAKLHWNTDKGKATWQDYHEAYLEYCA